MAWAWHKRDEFVVGSNSIDELLRRTWPTVPAPAVHALGIALRRADSGSDLERHVAVVLSELFDAAVFRRAR